MVSHKRILSFATAFAFCAVTAMAAQTPGRPASSTQKQAATSSKSSAPKMHLAEGSIVTATSEALTLRSGKKDMTFKLSSTTQKPTSMNPGSNVKVSYHDEGNQHIANSVELEASKPSTAVKATANK